MARRVTSTRRRGAAAVEFIVVAPVLIVLVMGAVELGRAIMVLDVLSHAARTGCRAGVLPASGNSDINSAVATTLTSAGVSGAGAPLIEVKPNGSSTWNSPGDAGSASSGDAIRVTVSITFSQVSWLPFTSWLDGSASLSSDVVMCRE